VNRTDYAGLVALHADQVLTLLRADPQLADVVFEGDVTGDPERYVNVWHDTGFFSAHDALGNDVDVEVTFTIHSVGYERWQAVWVSGRVVAALMNVLVRIPGRRAWRIRPAGSQPVTKDSEVSPPRFFAVDRFALRSTPRSGGA
jgi:hypothetical protein